MAPKTARVVVITGSGRGLGRAMAERFGAGGWCVAVSYRSSAQGAEQAASAIRSSGGEALVKQCDVRDYGEVQSLVSAAVDQWGRVDVFINNAGGGTPPWRQRSLNIRVHQIAEEEWDYVVGVNLKGTFHGIKAVAAQMISQRSGHIINVSAGTGLKGRVGLGHYAAAKAGVIGLTKTAARELGEYNIKVNAVCPGRITKEKDPRVSIVGRGRSPWAGRRG